MIKVMVVDDEQIVLDAMAFIIEKRQDQVNLCAVASSGREAIELARQNPPDILFMDIRMPGLSGIEAIEEIQTFAPMTKCVILSAYEQFEYAKQAVKLSVKEYLLKPINRSKVNQIIDKLVLEIEKESRHRQFEIQNIEKIRHMMPYLETVIIYSILSSYAQPLSSMTCLELLGIQKGQGTIATIELKAFNTENHTAKGPEALNDQLCSQEDYHKIRDVIKSVHVAIVGPMMLNKVVIFIPHESPLKPYDERVYHMQNAERMAQLIRNKLGRTCAIGFGNSHPLEDLHYGYQESLKALREIRGEGVFHIADLYGEGTDTLEVSKIKAQIIQRVELGKAEQALLYLDKLFAMIENRKEDCLELMVHVYRIAADANLPEDGVIHYQSYLKEVMDNQDTKSLLASMTTTVRHIASKVEQQKENKCSAAIERAKTMLNLEYTSEITLEGVARIIQMSPQYLSKLFKEQMGITFIDYLTDIRLDEAKRLMIEGEYSIKEICFRVGYTDPNYFSRVFKKRTGINPTDYSKKSVSGGTVLHHIGDNQ
jgi:two-component system response regulator YesN